MAPKYWMGTVPTQCDVTRQPIKDKFYDAAVGGRGGRWANMCPEAFRHYGCELGTGKGQEYTKQPDGRWLKTGG
jgi:hypothetical protein